MNTMPTAKDFALSPFCCAELHLFVMNKHVLVSAKHLMDEQQQLLDYKQDLATS